MSDTNCYGFGDATYGGNLPSDGEAATQFANESETAMTFPHQNEKPIGETKELAEEEGVYEASEKRNTKEDHAVGGSEGTTDGQ